MQGVYVSQA